MTAGIHVDENKQINKEYSIIDHTADIGLQASGETLEQAFQNAAKGMFDIISDNSVIKSERSLTINLVSDNFEELLVDFLSLLLYHYEVDGILFYEFEVRFQKKNGDIMLNAKALGEPFDRERHNYPIEIKAVTYHMLEVREDPPHITVIFDI